MPKKRIVVPVGKGSVPLADWIVALRSARERRTGWRQWTSIHRPDRRRPDGGELERPEPSLELRLRTLLGCGAEEVISLLQSLAAEDPRFRLIERGSLADGRANFALFVFELGEDAAGLDEEAQAQLGLLE